MNLLFNECKSIKIKVFIFLLWHLFLMMYEMFGELLLNNVLFALKRVDNLPADMHLAFKRKQLFGVYSNNCFCTFEF